MGIVYLDLAPKSIDEGPFKRPTVGPRIGARLSLGPHGVHRWEHRVIVVVGIEEHLGWLAEGIPSSNYLHHTTQLVIGMLSLDNIVGISHLIQLPNEVAFSTRGGSVVQAEVLVECCMAASANCRRFLLDRDRVELAVVGCCCLTLQTRRIAIDIDRL